MRVASSFSSQEQAVDYKSFFEKFGGSARTRNIATLLPPYVARGEVKRNLRLYSLPEQSGLPKEYIRLCPWEMEYLYAVARRARRGIIETGRYNGGSCFLMACAAPETPIYSIDIAPQNDELLRLLFEQHGVGKNVDLIVGDSQKTQYPQIGQIDLLFIDGDHSYEGCWNDMVNWYDHLVSDGHLLIHDSYLGKWGVQDAIIDLMDRHPELQVIQSPFIGAFYWHYPAGSLAHLIKRAAR
jgi:predicted O-methyltransferase YrrM